MRLTSFVVSKSWASNPLRTALSILGVALGIAIPTAIHVMDHNTIESQMRRLRPHFGRVDLELVALDPARTPEEVRAQLQAMPEIASLGVLQQGVVAVAAAAANEPWGNVSMYGLSPLPSAAFAHYHVAEGADLSDLDGDTGVLIGRRLAQDRELRPGAKLELSRPRVTARTLCRQGERIVVDDGSQFDPMTTTVEVKGILSDQRLGGRDDGVLVVTSYALARRLAPDQPALFQVNRASGADVELLRQQLAMEFDVLDERSALLGERSDERAFRNGVKVLGCLALVLGMFVIFQTLSQSLVERLRQIGLLRALGASRQAIASVFLLDAVATAVLGAVLGVGLGLGLAAALPGLLGISTLGRGKVVDVFEVPPWPLVWTVVIGIAFTVAGAAFPLWKARNLPALEVLAARGVGDGRRGETYVLRGVNLFLFAMLVLLLPVAYLAMTPILSEEKGEMRAVLLQLGGMILLFGGALLATPRLVQRLGGALLWPFRRKLPLTVFLVRRFVAQSPGRLAASVCGLAIVLIALLASKSITSALRAEAWAFGDVAMHRRLFVQPAAPLDPERARELIALPGVRAAELFEGQVDVRFPLRGLPAESLRRQGGVLEHRPELAKIYEQNRCLVISNRLARLRDKHAGDVLAVLTDAGPVNYTVVAVDDRAGFFPDERAWAVAAPQWLRSDFCTGHGIDRITLETEPGTDELALLAAVRGKIDAPWAKTGWELSAYQMRDVTFDFVLFDVLLALILVLAGVGLVNAMSIAALGRAREIGVLRALGVDKRALRGTFLLEGGIVAALAALLALALAAPLGAVVVAGLNRVAGLDAPFAMPWLWVAMVPVLAAATGLVAAIVPGLRATAESPAEAVRYE